MLDTATIRISANRALRLYREAGEVAIASALDKAIYVDSFPNSYTSEAGALAEAIMIAAAQDLPLEGHAHSIHSCIADKAWYRA